MVNKTFKNKKFTFTGYAFGGLKKHEGKFKKWSGRIEIVDDKIKSITTNFDAKTLDTKIPKLNKHLKSKDFFDTKNYPNIEFKSSKITNTKLVGKLTFKGKTKQLSIPITKEKNKISADYNLNIKDFGIKHLAVKKFARLTFSFNY